MRSPLLTSMVSGTTVAAVVLPFYMMVWRAFGGGISAY